MDRERGLVVVLKPSRNLNSTARLLIGKTFNLGGEAFLLLLHSRKKSVSTIILYNNSNDINEWC